MIALDSSQGEALAELANQKSWQEVTFIAEQRDYPLGFYTSYKNKADTLGSLTTKEEFAVGQDDFRTILEVFRTKLREIQMLTRNPQ